MTRMPSFVNTAVKGFSVVLSPPLNWKAAKGYCSFVTFLSRKKKSNQKKPLLSRFILRVTKPGEAARIMLSGKASSAARRAAIVRL
jgi:hypothetical protein